MLVAQKDAITRITGIITPESIDGLENELGGAFTKLKSTHFAEGQRYGFLATVIPQEKYCIVISDATWALSINGSELVLTQTCETLRFFIAPLNPPT